MVGEETTCDFAAASPRFDAERFALLAKQGAPNTLAHTGHRPASLADQ